MSSEQDIPEFPKLSSENGRWAIWFNNMHFSDAPGRGGFWCADATKPSCWDGRLEKMQECEYDWEFPPAIVLTEAESDAVVGNMSAEELKTKIEEFWGCLLPLELLTSDKYTDWLEYFIERNHCFGLVHSWIGVMVHYGTARAVYYDNNILAHGPRSCGTEDSVDFLDDIWIPPLERDSDESKDTIDLTHSWNACPRRLWDVCANRIVPFSWFPVMALSTLPVLPVSHAWVSDDQFDYVNTNVNYGMWPVPLPRGVKLEAVRGELIRCHARYAWLDVVCLWQPINTDAVPTSRLSPTSIEQKEQRRLAEWATDVPLCANIYSNAPLVLVYLNGLGRKFQDMGWESPWHWLQRNWTLQETNRLEKILFGGLWGTAADVDPWACKVNDSGATLKELLESYAQQLQDSDFGALITEVKRRYSTNPRDRVLSLGVFAEAESRRRYNYQSECSPGNLPVLIPAYDPTETEEDAWVRLVGTTLGLVTMRLEHTSHQPMHIPLAEKLMELFPHPSAEHWFPSWEQLMNYPNVNIKEPQLPSGTPPLIDSPLLVHAAHLYRGVKIEKAMDTSGTFTHFVASAPGGTDGNQYSVKLDPTVPDVEPALHEEDLQYVVIDATGFKLRYLPDTVEQGRILKPTIFPPSMFIPTSGSHLLIICKELTPWQLPSPAGKDKYGRPTGEKYSYRLRRVTSLYWTPAKDEKWLTFTPAASAHIVMDPNRSHPYFHNPEIFWNTDPKIEITLQ